MEAGMGYLIVFVGAGIGGAMRHGVNSLAALLLGTGFPFGTLAVNVVGSLAMGLIVEYLALMGEVSQHWRLFLATGVLGGFTTFSAFSLDAALLVERHAYGAAAGYMVGSVAASLAALFFGLAIFRTAGHLP
jgi:CrcB protein